MSALRVATAQVSLRIEGAFTLKDRRQVVKSLLDRLNRMNLSACDLDGGDYVNAAQLGIAAASADADHAMQTVRAAVDFIERDGRAEVVSVEYDCL